MNDRFFDRISNKCNKWYIRGGKRVEEHVNLQERVVRRSALFSSATLFGTRASHSIIPWNPSFASIDNVRPQTIISPKFHQFHEDLDGTHGADQREGEGKEEGERERKKAGASLDIHSCQWGERTMADRTKSLIYHSHRPGDICIGRRNEMRHNSSPSRTPVHCKPSNSVTRPLTCWNSLFYQGNYLIYHWPRYNTILLNHREPFAPSFPSLIELFLSLFVFVHGLIIMQQSFFFKPLLSKLESF